MTTRSVTWRRVLALSLAALVGGGLWAGAERAGTAKEPAKETAAKETPDKPATIVPAAPGGFVAYEQVRIINQLIAQQWKENTTKDAKGKEIPITPSKRCSDYEFIRRVSLDLIDRIAKPSEIARFLQDPAATRRALLIDRLLDSEEYAKNWANIWSVWLLTRSVPAGHQEQTQIWLEEQFARKNNGWDKITTGLLTATGENKENGAVNYILSHLGEAAQGGGEEGKFDMVPITSRTTRLFLGMRTQCTQCHDHPFNQQWKQFHFWGMNAFFRQVDRKGQPGMVGRNTPAALLTLVDNSSLNPDGAVFYEERKGVVKVTKATFLEGRDKKWDKEAPKTRRQQLAEYIIASPNFSRSYVNRMWGQFFGRGFTTQGSVDDFGEHNPVSHAFPDDAPQVEQLKAKYGEKPTLLDYLADEFVKYQYDPRTLIKWICNSEAYNLSAVANKTNDKADVEPFFSRMLLKSMSPEQLFESLMVATQAEAAEDKDGKKQLREAWMRNLIANFGDDEGNEVTFNGTVVQALLLMNGKEINEAINNKDRGVVARAMVKKGPMPKTAIDEMYLAALNRAPTPGELKAITEEVNMLKKTGKGSVKDVTALYQDVFWALLNSNEFLLNH